jgi:hypothetical protein
VAIGRGLDFTLPSWFMWHSTASFFSLWRDRGTTPPSTFHAPPSGQDPWLRGPNDWFASGSYSWFWLCLALDKLLNLSVPRISPYISILPSESYYLNLTGKLGETAKFSPTRKERFEVTRCTITTKSMAFEIRWTWFCRLASLLSWQVI